MISNRVFVRTALLVLAVLQGGLAVWALASPRGFYDGFPGGGREWVSALPPYNEHLVRDVGSLSLALTIVTVAAAVWTERRAVQAVALAWLGWTLPHAAYHATTTEAMSTSDNVLSFLGQGLEIGLALALLVVASRPAKPEPAPAHAAAAAGSQRIAARPDEGGRP